MNDRILIGTITAIEERGQTVTINNPGIEEHLKVLNLYGICRIAGNLPIGTKVVLTYRVDHRSGLWFGKVARTDCDLCIIHDEKPDMCQFRLCPWCGASWQ